jgi:Tol biopolymer transport system component
MFTTPGRVLVPVVMLAWALTGAQPASAQYFGQNKVQYRNLDFKVLKTDHFDIYFYPQEREGVEVAARLAERWEARLERIFGHKLKGRQPLLLFASHTDFEQQNVIPGEMGEGTGGVTEPLRRRIVLPFGGALADTDHVIGHELVHAFQFDITAPLNGTPGENGAERLPLWFIEGMAEYLTLGSVDPNTAMWLRDAARQEKLPTLKDLDDPKYFPYRWGQAFWAYVGGRWGDGVIRQMLSMAAAAGDPNVAIERVLGEKSTELSKDWQAAIRKMYEPILNTATPPDETGHLLVKGKEVSNDLNVGPSLSPDGRYMAFLSSRSLLSIDLYVAETQTGKILHRLTSTASDPHYSSIQFIYSAGSWDPESKRIIIATVANGRPALSIFNAQTGNKERDIPIDGAVDEIMNPSWSPDGHTIAFTGFRQGLTDLYLYDLNSSRLQQLTNDAYADLQPTWSPDGRQIAFATDRFSTNLDTLQIGSYRLALLDPASGRIEQVRSFTDGQDLNPQWSPDGRSLYFIADRGGIPNLYRTTIDGGDMVQLTSVATGLSGITTSSPALSIARQSGLAAFSVYQGSKYDVYTLDVSRRGSALEPLTMNAAALPPPDRRQNLVAALLADPVFGLQPAGAATVAEYRPKLALEGVGQPMIAAGADRFGAAIGGGASFFFSDMLGNHNLAAAVEFNSGLTRSFSLNDTAAEVAYIDQSHRWNWGLVAGQVPYLTGGFQTSIEASSGDIVENDQTIIYRQTERSASFLTAYPFNRAQRVEFQGGLSRISFEQITQSTRFSLLTGGLIGNDTQTTTLAPSITLGTASAALVYDTSTFGATSPVSGQRYRLEAAPTYGTIHFTSVLADYRRYIMPAPFYTIALRAIHYGRYGSGGEDSRLFPLFIGYPDLVRGYDIYTFSNSDCPSTANGSCAAIDRLLGSRTLVGNLELRFPLLRAGGVSNRMYGPVPVELALFADGGVAWNRGEKPSFLGGSRRGVSSVGAAVRVNLFGFAIGEFDFAKPLQRPGSGMVFEFNLAPGF